MSHTNVMHAEKFRNEVVYVFIVCPALFTYCYHISKTWSYHSSSSMHILYTIVHLYFYFINISALPHLAHLVWPLTSEVLALLQCVHCCWR